MAKLETRLSKVRDLAIEWLLIAPLAAVFVVAFFVYKATAPVYDWYRVRRKAGVLDLIETNQVPDATLDVDVAARSSLAASVIGEQDGSVVADEGSCAFGYTEFAHTAFLPGSEDDEWTAFYLAREPGRPALDRDPPFERSDRDIWDGYGLNDPALHRRYREEVRLGRVLTKTEHCLYCGTGLIMGKTAELRMYNRSHVWQYRTAECPRCGWWCVTYKFEERLFAWDADEYFHAYAVMRRFDPLALSTPLSLARDYLNRNPHKLARFDPYRFEDLMADCLEDYFGDGEIVKLGGRRDRGIDIKAVRAGGKTVLIQVKRRSDFAKREGVKAIRDLHGVMLREGVPRGMVVTTAHDFTAEAKAEVAQAGRHLRHYSMDLLPLADVLSLLGRAEAPRRFPWEAHGIQLDRAEPEWEGSEDDWVERAVLPHGVEHLY